MEINQFLDCSYTAYHTVANCRQMLSDNGFIPYDTTVTAKVGGKYYIEKNSSTIIAFKVGNVDNYAFNIALAHTDSPSLKVKGKTLTDSPEGSRINVEAYGGLIRYSFMDIPLKVAGRLLVKTKEGLKSSLVTSDFNVNIPSLCIHHSPDINEKSVLSVQQDMQPLVGGNAKDLYQLFPNGSEAVDGDLFVVPAVNSYYSGDGNMFLCSPRIDNLTSCYSLLQAIIECEPKGIAVCCLYDNEEIGSRTKQGAFSELLPLLLQRINNDLKKSPTDYVSALNNGFILSVDNGHAVHPAHPEKSDPKERVYLNKGVVIKHHTNYSTDGMTSACLKVLLDRHNIPYQDYYNNSDIRCGGTLGLIVSTMLQMNAVDIGIAQLAMHSAIETAGVKDISQMTDCVKAFYNSLFLTDGDNIKIL